jgi:hypothetical protein
MNPIRCSNDGDPASKTAKDFCCAEADTRRTARPGYEADTVFKINKLHIVIS